MFVCICQKFAQQLYCWWWVGFLFPFRSSVCPLLCPNPPPPLPHFISLNVICRFLQHGCEMQAGDREASSLWFKESHWGQRCTQAPVLSVTAVLGQLLLLSICWPSVEMSSALRRLRCPPWRDWASENSEPRSGLDTAWSLEGADASSYLCAVRKIWRELFRALAGI